MSLIILAGSAFSAGISSFAAQPEIEIMDIDNSNPFDYEHYINEEEEEAPGGGIDIIPNEEKKPKRPLFRLLMIRGITGMFLP